jgi:hypothetical protein
MQWLPGTAQYDCAALPLSLPPATSLWRWLPTIQDQLASVHNRIIMSQLQDQFASVHFCNIALG